MMQLLPLALHLSMVYLVLAAAVELKFNVTTSEVVRDDQDGGRIRGVRSRENATFVFGGLFPIHTHSADPSQGSPCGDIRQERGLERMEAMLFAIDTINADPDLLPGVDLGYDIRDTCNSETVGLDEAIDLIITGSNLNIESCEALPDASPAVNGTVPYAAVPTSGLVGAAGSGVSVPVASLGRLFRMPQVSYASTSPLLTDRSRYGYFRRTVPSDDLQALAMVDILQHFNWNYVSILHSEDTYGSAGINEFVNVSATNNICIDLRRGIPPTFSGSEYDNLVEDLRLSRARVVIIFANQESVGEVLTRVNRDETMRRNFTWIASDAWARSIDLVHQFNDTAAGLFGVAPLTEHLPAFEEYISKLTINSNTRNNWFPEFFAAFANCSLEDECDNDTDITSFSRYEQGNFVPLVVDAVYAFVHALQNFLVDNCNETDSAPFLWFKENGSCLGQSRELNGASLLPYLNDVNFTSITGNSITFDESGSVDGFYEILNYQANVSASGEVSYKFVSVGTWVSGNVGGQLILKDEVPLQFGLMSDGAPRTEPVESGCGGCMPGEYIREIPGSCCSICEPCRGRNYSSQPLAKNCSTCFVEEVREMWGNSPTTGSNSCITLPMVSPMYSDPWAIPSLILACIGLIFVAITAVIFGIYWKTAIVKSSGREQMTLLLIGIGCSFILPFFYVAPPSIPVCLVNRLGIWFCYSLMFGALAIKVQRVARIFYGIKRNLTYTPRFVSPAFQVSFTLIIVGVQMLVIVVSLAFIHPEVLHLYPFDENTIKEPEVIVTCQQESIAVLVLSLLYETAIIAVATVLGAFSFKYPENFNEAKYISFCTFALLVVWLGLIPTYFTTQSQPEIQNAAVSLFIILSAFGVLCFIFGPKLIIILFQPERNSTHFSTHHTINDPDSGIKMNTLGSQGSSKLTHSESANYSTQEAGNGTQKKQPPTNEL